MKKVIISLLACLLLGNLQAQTADSDVAAGLADLVNHDVVSANQEFTSAVALSPTNESANVLLAVTRLLALPATTSGSNLLNQLGFSAAGRDVYNWTSVLPTNSEGKTQFPNVNSSIIIAFYRANIMAALAASRSNLTVVTDTNFTLPLTAEQTSIQDVTLDYGDVLMLQSLERVAEFAGYTANAQNLDVVLSQLQSMSEAGTLSYQSLLSTYPSLLTQATPADLAPSKAALTNAINLYLAASDFIRNVRSPGAPALFVLSDDETNQETKFRDQLTNVLLAVNGPVQVHPPSAVTINASNYFSGAKSLRSLLPQFANDSYMPDSLPDYTFGGVLLNEPAYRTEEALREKFYSYAGIYTGSDQITYENNDYYGSFAIFVGTNQQATLVGDYAEAPATNGLGNGIFAQFPLDKNGNFSFTTNNCTGYGSIDSSGNISAEVDYTNGISVEFYSDQPSGQSPLGAFQNSAGYYNGTFDFGSLMAMHMILTADGEMFFTPVMPGNAAELSGSLLINTNNQINYTNLSFALGMDGLLVPSTHTISGAIIYEGSAGTFIVTRAASVPFDVPPVITQNLPLTLSAAAGTNVTLSLIATGSAPMSYQWYDNGVAIPSAITNVLTLSQISYADAGIYSVIIDNVGGETNAAVAVSVVPSSQLPTNHVNIPSSGQLWSNSLYTVTGSAASAGGVSAVWYQLGTGPWMEAATTNGWTNWSANLSLSPGNNTLRYYSVSAIPGPVYVADLGNNLIRKVTPAGVVSTLAGNTNSGFADGTNGSAQFYSPNAVGTDGSGNVYVTDTENNLIRKVTPAGVVTTLAGDTNDLVNGDPNAGYADGPNGTAMFFNPRGIALDAAGNVYVADTGNNLIRMITPAGVVTTLAGDTNDLVLGNSNSGYADGPNGAAMFYAPTGVSVDAAGNVYVADTGNNLIRMITPAGVVTTLAGDTNDLVLGNSNYGYADGTNGAAMFYGPTGVCVDGAGTVYVADTYNNLIRVISSSGGVTTLAGDVNDLINNSPYGNYYNLGAADGSQGEASFSGPTGVNLDASGNIYVGDTGNNLIRKVTPAGAVSTVAGNVTNVGYADGIGSAAEFYSPSGVAADTAGATVSVTNSSIVTYILSAPLQVTISGLGTISPNWTNTLLPINQPYSITSAPAYGFKFTGWVVSTNGISGAGSVANHILSFIMVSNLTLQADFADDLPPTNTITSPTNTPVVYGSALTVAGTARDNEAVTNVAYSLNGGAWTNATSSNGWTNWTGQVTLVPGTNFLSACAVDSSGNISPTNHADIFYVVTTPLTVLTNGLGTFSANDAGQLLRIGQDYSIAAIPASGFKFVSWTNSLTGPTYSSTNNFMMESNLVLTATFADTNWPVLAITNMASGLTVSNALFTVRGRASDNWSVSNVWVELGSNGYVQATGTTAWSQLLTLVPGTNTVRAYAMDSSGNFSVTNSASVFYVQTAQLTILTNGLGTFAPNDAGQLLRLGQDYSITATPASGFKFVSWNNSLTGPTNSATVSFVMASNLVLTATFADTNWPVLAITNMASGLTVSNALFTVRGRASDNWSVSNVWVELGTNGYVQATGSTTWSQLFTLAPGTNIVSAYAMDSSGNFSVTNSASVFYVQTAQLTIWTNGLGTVAPNDAGQLLRLGQNYSITATPASGFKFVNWTNSLTGPTNSATVSFVMASNLVLTATFADTNWPVVAITNMASGLTVSNAQFTVRGRASDNWSVSNVWVELGTNGYVQATGSTTWSQLLTLVPGTNIVGAYAMDSSGNFSVTNSASVFYVQTAQLTIWTNGLGTLSANDAGQALRIGQDYVITATPASGFKFVSWTNSLTGPTNSSTINFMMASNLVLTVTFADTNPPVVAITNIFAGEVVSNANFTVMGTARDNWEVLKVAYQFNSNGWSWAQGENNWSNWSAAVTLQPGTNLFQAYAVDTSGNQSLVVSNHLAYDFVLPGTWNLTEFITPALLTWDSTNALLLGDTVFVTTNGTLTLASDGTLSGNLGIPFTGSYGVLSNGLVAVEIVEDDSTNDFNVNLNASQDTLVYASPQDTYNPGAQSLLIGTRAPANATSANLAGLWNVVQFDTPEQILLDFNTSSSIVSEFFTTNATLTLNNNGTYTGTGGIGSGSYAIGSNGVITVSYVSNGETNRNTLFVNATQDTLVFFRTLGNGTCRVQLAVREPSSITGAAVAGLWNGVDFATPSLISWDPVNLLQGGADFSVVSGTMSLDANGHITAGDMDGAFTGAYTIGSAGLLSMTITNQSGIVKSGTAYLNLGQDTLTTVQTGTNGEQQLRIFQRATH